MFNQSTNVFKIGLQGVSAVACLSVEGQQMPKRRAAGATGSLSAGPHLEALAAAHGTQGGGGDEVVAALNYQLLQGEHHRRQQRRQPIPACALPTPQTGASCGCSTAPQLAAQPRPSPMQAQLCIPPRALDMLQSHTIELLLCTSSPAHSSGEAMTLGCAWGSITPKSGSEEHA